ncbi:MAG: glycosyltransferase family 4 protein [Lachnospiraceae bacterium]|nr:glycosyltransferase family 4 protein [Lachnospiraceae bacterium]
MTNKKVLFITTINIFDIRGNGGVKASAEHFRMLQRCFGENNVHACVFVKPEEKEYAEECAEGLQVDILEKVSGNGKLFLATLLGCRIYFPWKESNFYNYIDKVDPDLLFLDCSILGRIIKRRSSYKTVVFFHNIEADYVYNKVKNESIVFLTAYWDAKRSDKYAIMADRVICLNERDSNRMYELYGRKTDFYLPITFADSFDESKTQDEYRREILFVGSLFGPNQDGIEWFINNVLPKLDNITLVIVGRGFEAKKEQYEKNSNVKVVGSVDEPSVYYYAHAAVVMPIRYGAGMKVKTAEAMMFGRRIFASDEALEGYNIENVNGISRCNTPEEYAVLINEYYNNGRFKPFEEDVRKLFLSQYESEKMDRDFGRMLRELVDTDE